MLAPSTLFSALHSYTLLQSERVNVSIYTQFFNFLNHYDVTMQFFLISAPLIYKLPSLDNFKTQNSPYIKLRVLKISEFIASGKERL